MNMAKARKFLPVIAGVICLGAIIGYRITDTITENKARAKESAAVGAVSVDAAAAKKRIIDPVIVFSAGLEPEWITDISAKVDGRIAEMRAAEGDAVAAGEIAAILDNNDAKGEIMQAKGNVIAARSNLEQAELDYQRYLALEKDGAVAGQVLDNARTKRDAAKGQLQTAEGALALAEEKAANLNIVIPKSGVITKRHLQEGAFVRSGAAIFTVADTSTLIAKATVGESQVANLALGTKVRVETDAFAEDEIVGVITRISPVAELPARVFTADISIDNADGRLRAGMFAKAQIPVKSGGPVVAVPESAIVLREDQPSIYVLNEDQTVTQRIVKTGASGGGWIEIAEGLKEGERFVAGGQNKLRDGMKVNPVNRGEPD